VPRLLRISISLPTPRAAAGPGDEEILGAEEERGVGRRGVSGGRRWRLYRKKRREEEDFL